MNPDEQRIDDRESWKHPKRKQRTKALDGTPITLFVANLPDFSSRSWLLATFRKWRSVTDAFIPKKKDVVGKTFGFVRMTSGCEAEKAMTALNGHVVQGRKLLVNSARFKRNEISGMSRSSCSARAFKTDSDHPESLNKAYHEKGIKSSWVEVVQGTKPANPISSMTGSSEWIIELMTAQGRKKKLENGYISLW